LIFRLALAALALLSLACLSPRPAADARYFVPGRPSAADVAARPPETGPELRLRRVTSADYLRTRMVWRNGVEVGFYDLLRWTEPPASYVETRLAEELFERQGLRRVARPSAPVLRVELLHFDEVISPSHEAVVSLAVLLSNGEQEAILDRTVVARRPIAGDSPEEVARALGEALSEATASVGGEVSSALGASSGSE
jgi:ABC-type uncharacterized transport system auxiliary subunit